MRTFIRCRMLCVCVLEGLGPTPSLGERWRTSITYTQHQTPNECSYTLIKWFLVLLKLLGALGTENFGFRRFEKCHYQSQWALGAYFAACHREIAAHESTKSRTNVIYRSKCVRNVEFRWFRPLTSNEQVHASGFLEQTCVIAVFHLFQGRKSLELAHPKKDQKANF